MKRLVRAGWVLAVGLGGCSAVPPLENPAVMRPPAADCENPIVVSPGLPTPAGYAVVYGAVLDSLDDYFDFKPGSRFAGQIETLPRVAPGVEQPWRPGSPDHRERLLATLQSIRHYAVAKIEAGERGGFRVYVEVYKELENVSRPAAAQAGGGSFRESGTVDRRAEVIGSEPSSDRAWIPAGRDPAMEQAILRKVREKIGCR